MKRILILLILINFNGFSQEFKLNDKSISVVYKVDSVSKKEIHSRVLSAIANLYNSANNVTQLNDNQNFKIVVKGRSKFLTKNEMKPLLPKNPYVSSIIQISYNHTLNIDSKDGRYRVVFETTSKPKYEQANTDHLFGFETSFIKMTEDEISKMVEKKCKPLEKMKILYGKKKREAYKEGIPIAYEYFYSRYVDEAKSTMNAINKFVQQSSKSNPLTDDDW